MNETLEPDPEFNEHLEWQLRTELRRRARFSEAPASVSGKSRGFPQGLFRLSALVLLSVLLGGAGMAAVGHYQGRDARELAEARADLRLRLSERRMQLVSEDLERAEARYSNGLVGEEATAAARSKLATHRAEFARRALDAEEVRGSGRPPQDGLAAPLVGGRDFVRLRLELSLREAADRIDRARRHVRRIETRVSAGLVGDDELQRATAEVSREVLVHEQLARHMKLRARFLRGELAMRETDLLGAMETARTDLESARVQLALVQEELSRTERRVEAGMVTRAELEAGRLRAEESQGAVLVAELELEVLRGLLNR